LLAVLLAYGAARDGSRVAMLALGAIGVLALLIALIGDLPDAQASGLLVRSGHFVTASSSPSVGLYFETLGAVMLLIAAGVGFLLGGPPARATRPDLSAS
jgi:NADH:ubiquinone oxidoreductase subunit 5 (subunit L)/multisubunit Na+/H+ antiporter MnhA subunit